MGGVPILKALNRNQKKASQGPQVKAPLLKKNMRDPEKLYSNPTPKNMAEEVIPWARLMNRAPLAPVEEKLRSLLITRDI